MYTLQWQKRRDSLFGNCQMHSSYHAKQRLSRIWLFFEFFPNEAISIKFCWFCTDILMLLEAKQKSTSTIPYTFIFP